MGEGGSVFAARTVAAGWLAGALAAACVPLLVVVGQGVAAAAGGAAWIGLALPVHRQPWALVNQPTLAFAASPAAIGYWFGSLAAPMAVAALAVALLPRSRSVGGELVVIQLAFACAVFGCGWLPLLDPVDGHLARGLHFNDLPHTLRWLAPGFGGACAIAPTLRLLALARAGRYHLGRSARLAVVVVVLAVPCCAWVGISATLGGTLPIAPAVGAGVPLLVATAVALYGYPAPLPGTLPAVGASTLARLAIGGALMAAVLWAGGRTLPDGRTAGVLWAEPTGFNNVRSFVDARPIRSWLAPVIGRTTPGQPGPARQRSTAARVGP